MDPSVPARGIAAHTLRVMATTTTPIVARAPRVAWLRHGAVTGAVACWAALVLAGHILAARLLAADYRVHIGAPPLVGGFDVRLSPSIAVAAGIACAAVAFGPAVAQRVRWRALIAVSWLAGSVWIIALAIGNGGGWAAVRRPLLSRYEYLRAVPDVGDAGSFLRSFVADLPGYPTHVRGHPPGLLLALAQLDGVGLGGAAWATALVIGVGAAAAPAALVALRSLAGEPLARRAAPFVTLAPAAVWLGTSADALFCGVLAGGIALLALACRAPRTWRADATALLAGLVLGAGLMLSYGLAPLALLALAVGVCTRRVRPLALAAAGALAVMLAFAAAGFWWPEGLRATHALYAAGAAAQRPYLDFLVISPAAFALAIGPAAVAGLAALRGRAAWTLPAGALAALTLAELSGLSRGETERIWLPFAPWLLLAAAALRAPRPWLAAQLTLAIALQVVVVSQW